MFPWYWLISLCRSFLCKFCYDNFFSHGDWYVLMCLLRQVAVWWKFTSILLWPLWLSRCLFTGSWQLILFEVEGWKLRELLGLFCCKRVIISPLTTRYETSRILTLICRRLIRILGLRIIILICSRIIIAVFVNLLSKISD